MNTFRLEKKVDDKAHEIIREMAGLFQITRPEIAEHHTPDLMEVYDRGISEEGLQDGLKDQSFLQGHPYVAHLYYTTLDETMIGAMKTMFIETDHKQALVGDVAVHPDYRKKGVATNLIGTFHSDANDWNADRLVAMVSQTNEPSKALFQTLGFSPLPELYMNNLVYTKELR